MLSVPHLNQQNNNIGYHICKECCRKGRYRTYKISMVNHGFIGIKYLKPILNELVLRIGKWNRARSVQTRSRISELTNNPPPKVRKDTYANLVNVLVDARKEIWDVQHWQWFIVRIRRQRQTKEEEVKLFKTTRKVKGPMKWIEKNPDDRQLHWTWLWWLNFNEVIDGFNNHQIT